MARMPRLGYTKRLRLDEAARIGEGRALGPNQAPADGEPTESFDTLLAQKAAGQQTFFCEFGSYDLERLLRPLPEGMTSRRALGGGAAGDEHGPPVPPWSLAEEAIVLLLGGLGSLGSLVGGLVAVLDADSKVMGVVIGGIGAVGLLGFVALVGWLWRRGKLRPKRLWDRVRGVRRAE
uniref:Uncharacterized protein n=1 Tax=Candidatus Kentrum eta TaxID=2126337 RepID=A0A450V4X8_9GAMM|nr:MAG: hypothetical protein BECKH772A_GA0070896_101696 [Candidatus Kentron sp. H]VFJ99819.1 MAG: hypothetical protein BECKH772B_GA0070898_101696 [Candidatus Kentron sp. H]VFK04201.1 MAG: hypothetical protein BECKH772C_GA0070978_101666 [Candidatus Kentron sp. H]